LGTLQDYQPGALAATTYFRRRAISGMCSSFSNSIRVIVLPPITNNLIAVSKPAICFGTVPNTITGTALTGGAGGTPTWIWQQSTDGITWNGATGTANQQDYSPPALLVKTWYRRIIMSGLYDCCIDTSNVVTIDINPLPTGANAGADSSIISFDNMTQVSASPIQSYESGKWSVVAGTGDFENDAATTTYVKNISMGTDIYRWTVTNGECILTDDVTYEVSNPVIPEGISPNGDLKNDTLRIDGLDFINQIVELSVLNGAGTLVFSSSNKNGDKWINWDGKNSKGKELPEGTYYYLLKVASPKTGRVAKKSGFIILKRQ
jgi:gliding motility-associated-like protein